VSRVRENRTHGSRRRELETEHPVMVTAVKRPAGETRGKVAAGPDAGQCHRASSRPYILIRPAWPECHKMATVRRVAAEIQEAPGK
jgi:hypothetical protein